MIYGQRQIEPGQSEGGMPPEETNFLIAIKKTLEDNQDNPVAYATFITMAEILANRETMDLEEFKGYFKTYTKMALSSNKKKVKNSPLYSRLIQATWPILTQKVKIIKVDEKASNYQLLPVELNSCVARFFTHFKGA